MKWSSIGVKLAGLAAGLLLVGMIGGSASAYPPPTGSVSMSTSTVAPAPGSSISISTTVLNQYGSPAFGLSCTFGIVSQPGSSAVVDTAAKVTDASGVVSTTLNVGTTPGAVVVAANCGTLSGQISVDVQGAPSATGLRLPPTGTGPDESGSALLATLLACGLISVGAATGLRFAARRDRGC